MILTAHQPCYFPWLGLIHKAVVADVFVVLDTVQFGRGSYTNRVQVMGSNGPVWLTVPVSTNGRLDCSIRDLRFAHLRWWRKHWETLLQTYGKTQGWSEVLWSLSWMQHLDAHNPSSLADSTSRQLCNHYQAQTRWYSAMNIPETRGRSGNLMLIALCKSFGADSFLFGARGRNYVDYGAWKRAGIKPLFQRYEPVPYTQTRPGWVPGLSALDALCCLGPEAARQVMLAGGKVEE